MASDPPQEDRRGLRGGRGARAACWRRADDEQGVDEPAREGLAHRHRRASTTTSSSPGSSTSRSRRTRPTTRARPPSPGNALYGVFIQACNISEDEDRTTTDETSWWRTTRATSSSRSSCPRTTRSPTTARSCRARSASPRRAASPSSAPRPARCCCSTSRCENTENRPLELVVEGRDGDEALRARPVEGRFVPLGCSPPRRRSPLRRRVRRCPARRRPAGSPRRPPWARRRPSSAGT